MKVKKLLIALAVIGAYALVIVFIRLNPKMVEIRKAVGGIILGIWIVLFMLGLFVGGLLHPHYDDPKNAKERIGYVLTQIAVHSRFVIIFLFPIIIAMLID
ncbi:MAG: hypothetical protein J6X85_10295 [Ruminococcus sp.]|nr:hypothetical protein [Ruminococcus sp.]